LLVDATARSCGAETGVRDERMTSHLGCRDVTELIEETARVSAATAARWQRAAKAVRPAISDMTGELLEADFPSVRTAMIDGVIGVDGILAITGPLAETVPRVSAEARQAAADVVVAEARGEGPDGAARLRRGARDPRADVVDRPRSGRRRAARARGDPQALVRARHADRARRARPRALLPEVAAQLQTIFDAHLAPSVQFDDPFALDENGDLLPCPRSMTARARRSSTMRSRGSRRRGIQRPAAHDRRARAHPRRLGRRQRPCIAVPATPTQTAATSP
jgi:hypothetical protein